jgi:YebC/PmpR family DNA-binding regulatory protein
MPLDNIKRAILKGTGELPGQSYEESTYEGYGPGGVAVFIEVLTDNRNRSVAEIRHLFSKHGGNLGESGSVAWIFEKKGYITVSKEEISEEGLLEVVLETGGEDLQSEGDYYEVYCPVESFEEVKSALQAAGVKVEEASLTMIPQNEVRLEGKVAQQMIRLMDVLEEHEDVQNVYANFDIDEDEMEDWV